MGLSGGEKQGVAFGRSLYFNSDLIVLDEPTEITITENISDYSGYQISTSGGSDGTIVLNVVGGTNSFNYQWSTNDGSGLTVNQKDQSGLSAGTYTVVV